jgi:hypothetical protein
MHEPIIPAEAGPPGEPPVLEQASEEVRAWEEIDVGRFMPRRIRGSYRGGQLG